MTSPAELRELRRQLGEAAARVQLAHEDAVARLDPGADDRWSGICAGPGTRPPPPSTPCRTR
jgi:hypothetical protein